jgi:hypothetical protein
MTVKCLSRECKGLTWYRGAKVISLAPACPPAVLLTEVTIRLEEMFLGFEDVALTRLNIPFRLTISRATSF